MDATSDERHDRAQDRAPDRAPDCALDRAQERAQDRERESAPDRAQDGDVVAALLAARVSEVIAAHPRALDLLVAHGFSLLAQAPLRRALAPTVTLAQALRIRGLGQSAEAALLRSLDEAGVARAMAGARCR